MTTLTAGTRTNRSSFSYPFVGTLLLATTISFFLGRATVAMGHAGQGPATPAAAGQAPRADPAAAPPWSQHGFRDDESVKDACLDPCCNG